MDHEMNRDREDEGGPDLDLIARYVAGECSADEAADVERRLADDAALRGLLAEIRCIWEKARVAPSGWDTDAAWDSVSRQLDEPTLEEAPGVVPLDPTSVPSQRPPRTARRPKRRAATPALRIAAVLAFAALAGTVYYQAVVASSKPPAREFVTAAGERGQVQLEDGTRITLGVASRLRVAQGYGKRSRRVAIEGVAFFEVSHDPDRAFVVRTPRSRIEVLGTRFDVRAYPGDTITQVVVAEGRVALRADNRSESQAVALEAGQLGLATAAGQVDVHDRVDVARYHAWTDGRLVFESTPLARALPELSRWYGLQFRLGDPEIAQLPVTAAFTDQPTAEILELLALSLDLRIERRGDTIIFHARNP